MSVNCLNFSITVFVQVLTVFFGSFIAGSLLNQINAIIHDPTTLVDILGDAAPQVAVFFMTYLLLMVRLLSAAPGLVLPHVIYEARRDLLHGSFCRNSCQLWLRPA